jgi:hypothetical protein
MWKSKDSLLFLHAIGVYLALTPQEGLRRVKVISNIL